MMRMRPAQHGHGGSGSGGSTGSADFAGGATARSSRARAMLALNASYSASQRVRKRIEEAFGWMKTIAGQRKTKFRRVDRVGWAFAFALASAYGAHHPLAFRYPF